MNIEHLQKNLKTNFEGIASHEEQFPKKLETLFELYTQTEAAHLEKSGAKGLELFRLYGFGIDVSA